MTLERKQPTKRGEMLRRTPMKRSTKRMSSTGPRMTPARRAAKGQECTLQLVGVCNHDSATVVLCHSNRLADGKGMGLKAPDSAAAFGCHACHDVLDGRRPLPGWITREQLDIAFDRGVEITQELLKHKGIDV